VGNRVSGELLRSSHGKLGVVNANLIYLFIYFSCLFLYPDSLSRSLLCCIFISEGFLKLGVVQKYAETVPEGEKEFSGPLPSIHNQVGWETYCFGKSTSPVEEEAVVATEDSLASTGEDTILSTEEDQPTSMGEGVQTETDKSFDNVSLPNLDSVTDFPVLGTTSDEELGSSHEPASRKLKDAIEESSMLIPPTQNVSKDRVKRKPTDLKGPNAPLLGILMRLDEVKRAALLRYHIAWLERVDGLPEDRAQWLFALSVVVDKPLDAQTMAAYRALLRRCIHSSYPDSDLSTLHLLQFLLNDQIMVIPQVFDCGVIFVDWVYM
jgi:hypothetical protein